MKFFNVIGINEGTKEKEMMFCSEINGGKITSFNDEHSVSLSSHPKKRTHHFLHSTSHFGNTSGTWLLVFFGIAELVFMITELKQK